LEVIHLKNMPSPFKSAKGEAEYGAAYDALMHLWPVPYKPLDISGRFGSTHLVVSGPENAPPVVLLHGYFATLAMWAANAPALSKNYRVYAVDVMGQPSRSTPDQPIRSRVDFVEWLTTILDALRIERAHLVGMSYGGWLTLNYAISAPDRVERIALLSPAGSFLPNVTGFTLRTLPIMLFHRRFWVERFMRWLTYTENLQDPDVRRFTDYEVTQLYLGSKHFRMHPETLQILPAPFSDSELSTMRVPTLLLIGQQEVLYDPVAALDRAERLIPNLEGALIPRASHDMSYSQHDVVDARILEFLTRPHSVLREVAEAV
jgi:pimeloyl-ACP methyl ester carboxylesterase